jgi:hypothetical protein
LSGIYNVPRGGTRAKELGENAYPLADCAAPPAVVNLQGKSLHWSRAAMIVQLQTIGEAIMMRMIKAAMVAGALAVPMAAPTSAQGPIVIGPGGLVNVQIVDVIDDVTVEVEDINVNLAVALQLAANVCGVGVNVLSQQLESGTATCDAVIEDGTRIVTINR